MIAAARTRAACAIVDFALFWVLPQPGPEPGIVRRALVARLQLSWLVRRLDFFSVLGAEALKVPGCARRIAPRVLTADDLGLRSLLRWTVAFGVPWGFFVVFIAMEFKEYVAR